MAKLLACCINSFGVFWLALQLELEILAIAYSFDEINELSFTAIYLHLFLLLLFFCLLELIDRFLFTNADISAYSLLI